MNVAAGVIRGVEAEVQRLQRENELWFQTMKRLMPYVWHQPACTGACTCGVRDVLTEVKTLFEQAATNTRD